MSKEQPRRKNVRLKDYDYSTPGGYFVTICSWGKLPIFGEFCGNKIALSDFGCIAEEERLRTPLIRKEIKLDEFVIMPDHFHAIVFICGCEVGATGRSPLQANGQQKWPHGPSRKSLGSLIAGFKASVTRRINELRNTPGQAVWQRSYYEHVIRDASDLAALRAYIQNNPMLLNDSGLGK